MPTPPRPLAAALPLLVLAVAGAVSRAVWDAQRSELQRALQADVDTQAKELAAQVELHVLGYEQALRAAQAQFTARAPADAAFRAAVARLRLARHPGLQGLGWAERLPADEGARVRYFEPARAGELRVPVGSVLAQPAHRDALAAARTPGAPAISRRVQADAGARSGHHMYLLVQDAGLATGWIFAAFSLDHLQQATRSGHVVRVADAGGRPATLASGVLVASQRVQASGQAWDVSVEAPPPEAHPAAAGQLQLVAGAGIVTSLLLALATALLLRRQSRLQRADAALRAAMERAEAASRAKSQFLAAASHDLRQPVQALGLFTAALQAMARRAQVNGNELGQLAGRLQASLQGLGRLLNGLFELSALESGTVEPAPRPVAIGELLTELRDTFLGPAHEKGLRLRVRAPRGMWVRTDPVVLMRVLSNLVANALRYTTQGRVLVGCRRRAGGRVEFQVLDTGIGIAPPEQARIFGEFYQVAGVARGGERGLGLGLATAQRLAQLLGSRVEVRSVPGRGSVFSLVLPLAPAPEAIRTAAPARAGAARLAGPVLLIDDDAQLTDALQRLLQASGHASLCAGGVDTALSAAAHAEADSGVALIVSDYQLEHATGIDAIRAVTERLGRPVPAILVTGDTSVGAADAARRHGYPLLHKPVDPAALLAAIEAAASTAESR